MTSRWGRLLAPTTLLVAVFGFAGALPAHAADYTIDCSRTQGAPYTDNDPDPAIYYGIYNFNYDGTQTQTITVNILNCTYHLVRHPAGDVASGYMGQAANETYTITLPVDGWADAWGYNIWDNPQRTTFIINMYNPTPTDGGGGGGEGDGGGGGEGDGGGGEGDGGGVNESGAGPNSATLPQTGFDSAGTAVLGAFALALGAVLSFIRRVRRRG
jgi:LPXTG-motif cell wall-anchored protein